ncbi:class I SAM-dependent methyltransferase [Chromobacterium haemolyticum]|uniref:site-specific DNA-methyltransferase n=1 Tax=Chromobacterium haemolyticum TaxID=394935 RepID=UPI001317CCA9|nr:site-specific DNA-methyltransferase [Chromobacterium haemolyticum]BBH15052.1 modification methylase, putative [Chromobacterium haemolyticum]
MRNHPENYLHALQQHLAVAPEVTSETAREKEGIDLSKSSETITTNQQGKITAFQRWFSFKEAFSPAFVIGAIEGLGYTPEHIIDPFGGSGTTALTAQLLGIQATTIEVNPFLADLISAKVTSVTSEQLRTAIADFQVRLLDTPVNILRLSHLPQTFVEDESKARWIFPKEIAKRITQYLDVIDTFNDITIQRLFKVALGAILVPCSNVYINGKGRRYRRSWQINQCNKSDLDSQFRDQLNIIFEDSLRFENRSNSLINVIHNDSRVALSSINKKADLIIFSPPYPNSFDYTDIYNIELWMLDYLKCSIDNKGLRNNTMRSHVQVNRGYDWPRTASPSLQMIYGELDTARNQLWDRKIPDMITAYFKDLEDILIQCYRLLNQTGKVIIVVGDSKYADVLINVADVLSEIAHGIGFSRITRTEVRKMRASAQQGGRHQLREWVLELSH